MGKWVHSITAVLFIIWLLPLGVFIKPSQEKVACDGQRAICMCSHVKPETKTHPISGYGLQASPEASKESTSSSNGAGNFFLSSNIPIQPILRTNLINQQILLQSSNPFLRCIDHVPKF